jgi:hypothetical protein
MQLVDAMRVRCDFNGQKAAGVPFRLRNTSLKRKANSSSAGGSNPEIRLSLTDIGYGREPLWQFVEKSQRRDAGSDQRNPLMPRKQGAILVAEKRLERCSGRQNTARKPRQVLGAQE